MGETAGQRAPHALLHLVPRHKGDKFHFNVWEPKKFSEEEFKMQQQKLSALVYKGAQILQQRTQQQVTQQSQQPSMQQEKPKEQKPPEKKIYHLEPSRGGYWG
jgi:diadenosine tetraphosphate (Ap4A) HIT family hydrolase